MLKTSNLDFCMLALGYWQHFCHEHQLETIEILLSPSQRREAPLGEGY